MQLKYEWKFKESVRNHVGDLQEWVGQSWVLKAIRGNNDLLWEDYEEKLADQAVRTMENYVAQFSEIKVLNLQNQGGVMSGPY